MNTVNLPTSKQEENDTTKTIPAHVATISLAKDQCTLLKSTNENKSCTGRCAFHNL